VCKSPRGFTGTVRLDTGIIRPYVALRAHHDPTAAREYAMARTPSTMLELGTPAPDFALTDTAGDIVRLSDFDGAPALLVMFICNHCPFVKHVRSELAAIGRYYAARGVGVVAISANDPEAYPDDSPERMAQEKEAAGYVFPYLFDGTQEVAAAYRSACTPDFYVFDGGRRLVYRGQLDDSRPGSDVPVTGRDLRAALDAVLAGRAPDPDQKPSLGCNTKWRPGNEPDWWGRL
jgi:peroxiredoxin